MNDAPELLVSKSEHAAQACLASSPAHILRSYARGKPLFPRPLLADLDRQLALGKSHVRIDDFDDTAHEYSLTVPDSCHDTADTYQIHYSSLQSLTNIHPSLVEDISPCPVSIVYTGYREPRRSLAEMKRAFRFHRRAWLKSETCLRLKRQMTSAAHSLYITKIVCFGLGPLGLMHDRSVARSHTQHAAVETIAGIIKGERSCDILCYAQDPAYDNADKELLHNIGIITLHDPKGFLEVDPNTLVISISPNIPVKQIIADVQWPGGMIWNTVEPEGQESTAWTKQIISGLESWIAPFTTDPDSDRVRRMAAKYLQEEFHDSESLFGELTICIRKTP